MSKKEDPAKLGEEPPKGAERDAVHLALMPLVAAETLHPGDHVGFKSDYEVGKVDRKKCFGIADPLRPGLIRKGSRVWVAMYPGTVTGMRHQWEHPQFPFESWGTQAFMAAEMWLKTWCSTMRIEYDEFLGSVLKKEHASFGNDLNYDEAADEELWHNLSIVLRRPFDDMDERKAVTGNWSCAC